MYVCKELLDENKEKEQYEKEQEERRVLDFMFDMYFGVTIGVVMIGIAIIIYFIKNGGF